MPLRGHPFHPDLGLRHSGVALHHRCRQVGIVTGIRSVTHGTCALNAPWRAATGGLRRRLCVERVISSPTHTLVIRGAFFISWYWMMPLRDRVPVPTIWMGGWQAAARRVSEMLQRTPRGGAPDSVRIDFEQLMRSDPSLLTPLAVPVITPSLLDQAVEGLEQRNVLRFLGYASGNEYWIDLLAANVPGPQAAPARPACATPSSPATTAADRGGLRRVDQALHRLSWQASLSPTWASRKTTRFLTSRRRQRRR